MSRRDNRSHSFILFLLLMFPHHFHLMAPTRRTALCNRWTCYMLRSVSANTALGFNVHLWQIVGTIPLQIPARLICL